MPGAGGLAQRLANATASTVRELATTLLVQSQQPSLSTNESWSAPAGAVLNSSSAPGSASTSASAVGAAEQLNLFSTSASNITSTLSTAASTQLSTSTSTSQVFHEPPVPEQSAAIFIYGFCLVLIPTATILGNLLVIISVLRFKALHSAINFLILGLAVADLFVALFVMPYAVYVYVSFWAGMCLIL